MSDEQTMHQRMLAGELYIADDPEIIKDSERAMELTHRINHADPRDHALLRALYVELFGEFGEGSHVRPPFHCDYGYQTTIGANSFANFGW